MSNCTPRSRGDLIENLQEANVSLMIVVDDILPRCPLSKEYMEGLAAAQRITQHVLTELMREDIAAVLTTRAENGGDSDV